MEHYCLRKIKMYPDEWQQLEQIAVDTSSHARHGTDNLQNTWQTLIRRIARGELAVTDPKPYQIPAGLDEAVRQMKELRQEQERIEQERALHRQRVEAHTQAKESVRKVPVKMQQLNMLEPEPA